LFLDARKSVMREMPEKTLHKAKNPPAREFLAVGREIFG
jgi:hypothetical protein